MTKRILGPMDFSKMLPVPVPGKATTAMAERARRMSVDGHGLRAIASTLCPSRQVPRWLMTVERR